MTNLVTVEHALAAGHPMLGVLRAAPLGLELVAMRRVDGTSRHFAYGLVCHPAYGLELIGIHAPALPRRLEVGLALTLRFVVSIVVASRTLAR